MLERDWPGLDLDLAPVAARVELADVGQAQSAALRPLDAQPLVAHDVDLAGEDDPVRGRVVPRYDVVACNYSIGCEFYTATSGWRGYFVDKTKLQGRVTE